jgi:hypothetical protein
VNIIKKKKKFIDKNIFIIYLSELNLIKCNYFFFFYSIFSSNLKSLRFFIAYIQTCLLELIFGLLIYIFFNYVDLSLLI